MPRAKFEQGGNDFGETAMIKAVFEKYAPWWFLATLLVAFCIELNSGATALNIIKAFSDSIFNRDSLEQLILLEIRLPRALLALTVGASLGLAGAALQGLLRNPLADPGLVGVSNGAALGAVIALYFGLGSISQFIIPVMGMIGAGLAVTVVFVLAGKNSSVSKLLLAGVAVNALTSSLIALALNFAPNPYAMSEIVFWLLGSIANRSLFDVAFALPFMLLGWLLILSTGKYLTALSLGEKTSQTMGFRPKVERSILVVGVALCVGAAVSVSGSIGFIGLVVPHLIRPLVKYEPGKLLFLSALAGGILLLVADIAVQYVSTGQEIKLGVITALVGGPFFLYLIVKSRYGIDS
jgi:iron complex transport system permease protein